MRALTFATTLAALAALPACAPMPPPGGPPPVSGVCNADGARGAIGRAPTPDVVERARIDSGSNSVRVLGPNDMATMDFRPDRLNLITNDRGAITSARCG